MLCVRIWNLKKFMPSPPNHTRCKPLPRPFPLPLRNRPAFVQSTLHSIPASLQPTPAMQRTNASPSRAHPPQSVPSHTWAMPRARYPIHQVLRLRNRRKEKQKEETNRNPEERYPPPTTP